MKLVKAVKELQLKHCKEGEDDRSHLFAKCSSTECGTYLQYKKLANPAIPAMPKDLMGQRQRCIEFISSPSPPCSPHASDDEGEEVVVSDHAGAAGVLLGMASSSGVSLDVLADYSEAFDGEMYAADV